MRTLAAVTGAITLAAALAACSSSGSSSTSSGPTAKTPTVKATTETAYGKVTGAAVVSNSAPVFPLKFTGVVNTTGKVTLPSGNSTHATLTFTTGAGNLVVDAYAPGASSNSPGTPVGPASACRFASTLHATYTVDGSKSTGKFAGATGSGKAAVFFEASAPKLSDGKCNLSSNAQPLTTPTPIATFSSTGPMTVK